MSSLLNFVIVDRFELELFQILKTLILLSASNSQDIIIVSRLSKTYYLVKSYKDLIPVSDLAYKN